MFNFYLEASIFLLVVVKCILTISLLIKYCARRSTIVKREFCIWQIYISNKQNPSSLGTLLPAVNRHYATGFVSSSGTQISALKKLWQSCGTVKHYLIVLLS